MNKHVILLGTLFAVACGGGGGSSQTGADAQPNPACGNANAFGTCADGSDGPQKCTWVTDENDPTANNCMGAYLGHVACEPAGTVGLAQACQFNFCNDGTTPGSNGACDDGKPVIGYDNCATGTYCIHGRCETMCSVEINGTPTCDADHACNAYVDVFGDAAGNDAAGVCDERCDPNTQQTRDDGTQACRSTNPAQAGSGSAEVYPNLGCYEAGTPFLDFACTDTPFGHTIAGSGSSCSAGTVTDPAEDQQPCTDAAGCGEVLPDTGMQIFFSNGCAPGYVNELTATTASTTTICVAYCSPADTDNTQPANGVGNGSALGKTPQDPVAIAGRATCNLDGSGGSGGSGGKATDAGETCVYAWPFLAAGSNVLPFLAGGSNVLPQNLNVDIDTIGLCIVNSNYTYDVNPSLGSAGPTKPGLFGPDCATLEPGFIPTDPNACAACGSNDICVGSGADVCHEINVACGSGSNQNANHDDQPGNEADCFALFHSCYNSVESGIMSGSATPEVAPNVARVYVPRDVSVRGNERGLFRRAGGIH